MGVESIWQFWIGHQELDPVLRAELLGLIAAGANEELEERFGRELEFGTGGMRAKLGVGTNRMNVHTVRRTTAAVVKWLIAKHPAKRNLAISYDGRHQSRVFAEAIAGVAAAHEVQAILYQQARPTPFLSYAVRHLGCGAGVMVTASHNPPEYNGYKVYGDDGGQILADDAETIVNLMQAQDAFAVEYLEPVQSKYHEWVVETDEQLEMDYFRELAPLSGLVAKDAKEELRIVYTPLHGTGAEVVPEALRRAGFTHVFPVAKQMALDPDFQNTRSPNPEEPAAYELALEVAKEVDADIILATDPDADRVGMMARAASGEYVFLSGNEVGALALDFYLRTLREQGRLPLQGRVVTTIVTSDFGEAVAASYGIATERTLTGFKYIGEKIHLYETVGTGVFLFGYEESVGYLALPFVRDKDAVQAAVLLAGMAASDKQLVGSVVAARNELFRKHGVFQDRLLNFTFAGLEGPAKMEAFMASLRKQPLVIEGVELVAVEDYLLLERRELTTDLVTSLELPEADVVKCFFAGGSWLAARPSGTEPKLKVYFGGRGTNEADTASVMAAMDLALRERIQPFLQE